MNLQEQLEKAFVAGAEYMRDEAYADEFEHVEMPIESEVMRAAERYINTEALSGSSESV